LIWDRPFRYGKGLIKGKKRRAYQSTKWIFITIDIGGFYIIEIRGVLVTIIVKSLFVTKVGGMSFVEMVIIIIEIIVV